MSDGAAAESYALQAITAYESGPEEERSYGDLALARVYLAQAQLMKPASRRDPGAAYDVMRDVLALPPARRIAGLRRPLHHMKAQLDREPVRHTIEARRLRTEIADFLTGTRTVTQA